MTKIGIIDMGTNTFHLLIAGKDADAYRILYRDHEPVKLGVGGINEGFIPEDACRRAIQTMKKFRSAIDENNVSTVYAYGTSAFRNARNAPALMAEIKAETGITVEIISGDEEADFIFQGIKAAIDLGEEEVSLIMDIGAGSVEFILGNNRAIYWKQSFEIGGQRLLEKFQKHDPITSDEIKTLDIYLDEVLQPLLAALKKFEPSTLVGSSGTFDTLSHIFCIRRVIAINPEQSETPLTVEGFNEIYGELIRKNRNERMAIDGMIALRVDMIVVASCLIRFILEKHNFKSIRVSTYSLKEGVLSKLSNVLRNF
jgi:exopolyphosphatase/guanosine-5'-triphosphate,3'-diphosphate pyrophosphatase